ncbi:hypothetical protein [Yoonia litorea]|uniref:Uncharacterized protein n=1 Tax=Yoonia litorea TaxID=1123755 RepID=A0A1I6LXY4_9RHOB|nr:hypothetical protein [Yoonia litorea]SFS08316.1 hypothetical protein SAMN05444714_1008 [Yoonia litorea]
MRPLDDRLLAAHARDDRIGLVDLYTEAADAAASLDAACFYLTQAYIFGLESNHPAVPTLHARLSKEGRV